MKPYYQQDKWAIYYGDCREVLPTFPKASAIVTDPPYHLVSISERFGSATAHNTPAMNTPEGSVWARKARGFMGKEWDGTGISFQKETWEIVRDSCLSGAMLLSFGGTRTFHRIACAIEDAGWEIRDTVMWVYGSGFPKSLDISKAIDYDACREQLTKKLGRTPTKDELKEAWAEFRIVIGVTKAGSKERHGYKGDMAIMPFETTTVELSITKPTTPEAQLWEGYGTALKPAYEPIILAMNSLDGTFANNALKHGVAGLNIEECRIGTESHIVHGKEAGKFQPTGGETIKDYHEVSGRFPANFIHDGNQMVMELFPNSKSTGGCTIKRSGGGNVGSGKANEVWRTNDDPGYGDNGSAARFFYCAKASKAERDRGCEDMPDAIKQNPMRSANGTGEKNFVGGFPDIVAKNTHPTVKPLSLVTYLVKLVKMPEYNLVIDPFMGSGTTLLACIRLGIPCIGIDNDEKSCEIAAKRCCQEAIELN